VTTRTILEALPHPVKHVLETAQNSVREGNLYLVGGLVRDVLLGQTEHLKDIDLVVEGAKAADVVAALQKVLGGTPQCHEHFGTCTLVANGTLIDTITIDIVTARREHYDPPGTLPAVTFSTISDDLARRDFSINALALRLLPKPLELLDFHAGLTDLRAKKLRVLHGRSFLDDPTRIVRGARLGGRLGFAWEEQTRADIDEALTAPTLKNVSKDRFKGELGLTLSEPQVTPILVMLEKCNALETLFDLTLNPTLTERLDTLRQTQNVPDESYLLGLLLAKPESQLAQWLETFTYPTRYLENLKRLRLIQASNEVSSGQFVKLSEAEKMTARALSEHLDERVQTLTGQFQERRLAGKDVIDLGLKSGPQVGEVLARVANARDAGQVFTFDDELELAKELVRVMERL
jgi:tRNA nucleotidyltransferase (CCA-adding enzyme)